jgi:hypothetical protein
MTGAMEAGCTCCVMMNGTPVCPWLETVKPDVMPQSPSGVAIGSVQRNWEALTGDVSPGHLEDRPRKSREGVVAFRRRGKCVNCPRFAASSVWSVGRLRQSWSLAGIAARATPSGGTISAAAPSSTRNQASNRTISCDRASPRSLSWARASIWRTRSLVIPSSWPSCVSVCSHSPPIP